MQTMYPSQTGSPELTLASAISSADTSITVNEDVTQLPSAPNLATVYDEYSGIYETVLYESVSSATNTLGTLTRGFEGSAQSWSSGETVSRLLTAYDVSAFKTNILENSSNIFGGSHSDLTGVGSSDHHAKYTDSEAEAAINAFLTQGSNITLTHSSSAGTLTVAVNSSGLDADTLDSKELANIDWADVAMTESDVTSSNWGDYELQVVSSEPASPSSDVIYFVEEST